MKRTRWISLFLMVALSLSLALPAFATEERASMQIENYEINVTVSRGKINVEFSVDGISKMDKLGCESIYIYKDTSSTPAGSRLEDDFGMSKTDASSHKNTISLPASAGVKYTVVVTIFAENSDGRDTRQETFSVTGK